MGSARGLECLWDNPKNNPQCPHGPTLLFRKSTEDGAEEFYVCSACRDRKLCRFYLKDGEELTKEKIAMWEMEKKQLVSRYPHRKLYIRFNEVVTQGPGNRNYCHNCEMLVLRSEKDKHPEHKMTENLSDYQMNHPTEILKPLENSRKEAQYLFSKKSVEELTNMLVKLGAKQVLCIGAPKIHEYITENLDGKVSSLLLDIDARFHNFFGPLSYCWYNLFNNHFFHEDAVEVLKDFMTQNGGKDTFLICDPPFGGRVEAISMTMRKISKLHMKWNNIQDENSYLKIFFIFPYFMEPILKHKSNPPSVPGGLRDLKMSDYKVDYENHPLFVTETTGKKLASPVRIFTNVPLNLLELSELDGYKYCEKCKKWVSQENKHCKMCKECTSKDGRRYRHCKKCERCVKPTWKHCNKCATCLLEKHYCKTKKIITGRCYKCNEFGHVEKNCDAIQEEKSCSAKIKNTKKRKINAKEGVIKRKKLTDTNEDVDEKAESPNNETEPVKPKKILKKTRVKTVSPAIKKAKTLFKVSSKPLKQTKLNGQPGKIRKEKKKKSDA